jgi:DNA recombination protein RmuC
METALLVALGLFAGLAIAGLAVFFSRARTPVPDPAADRLDTAMLELSRLQSETAVRVQTMGEMLAGRHAEMARGLNERLDAATHRLGHSMQASTQHTAEHLARLNERLALIDSAQKNISDLASQVTSLQGVLASKQQRGAFGQGRMEIIVSDGLPRDCYEFQNTLSNNSRPDCCILMPDKRRLVIDAKFPLESVTAFREAKQDDARTVAARQVRQDIAKHISDIAQKYIIPGETQDWALMFVPSESVYADLYDGFDDVFQKAFRAKVVIVSPSLLMLAIHIIQQIQKDARMREAADKIHAEVGNLMDDIGRLGDRVRKLQQHHNQSTEDVRQVLISVEKIEKRGERIREVEFDDDEAASADNVIAVSVRKVGSGEF